MGIVVCMHCGEVIEYVERTSMPPYWRHLYSERSACDVYATPQEKAPNHPVFRNLLHHGP